MKTTKEPNTLLENSPQLSNLGKRNHRCLLRNSKPQTNPDIFLHFPESEKRKTAISTQQTLKFPLFSL